MKKYLFIAIILISLVMMASVKNAISCYSAWEKSKYNLIAGCMVKTQEGFIPEKNVIVIHWLNNEGDLESE